MYAFNIQFIPIFYLHHDAISYPKRRRFVVRSNDNVYITADQPGEPCHLQWQVVEMGDLHRAEHMLEHHQIQLGKSQPKGN